MKTARHNARPTLEPLEERALMAGTLRASLLSNGTLQVVGTDRADAIRVREAGGRVSVDGVRVNARGILTDSVSLALVKDVRVWGYGGGDYIDLNANDSAALRVRGYVYAGEGADTVLGGHGDDSVMGEGGNDLLYGRGGNDTLLGGNGRDSLNGGAGFDKFAGGADFDTYHDDFTVGQPVYRGTVVSDINQEQSPTCATLAALATAVKQGWDFADEITWAGGNYYDVDLHGGYRDQRVYFNGTWTDNDPMPANGQPEFWTIVMQRARLQSLGVDWGREKADDWAADKARTRGRLTNTDDALKAFTGRDATWYEMNRVSAAGLQDSLGRGKMVVAASKVTNNTARDGIAPQHAYAVLQVYKDGGVVKVRLYNPWGSDASGGRTIDSLSGLPANDDGFITITWSAFTAYFRGVYVA